MVGGLLVLGAAWIAITGVESVKAAHRVQRDLQAINYYLSRGQLSQVKSVSADLASQASRAHRLTTGPAWWMASSIPYFGEPLRVVRGLSEASHELSNQTVPEVIDLATALDPNKLRPRGDTINLNAIIGAAPQLARVAASLDHAARQLRSLPANTWLGAVNRANQEVSARLQTISGYVTAANRTAAILPEMAGNTGPKRYFVGFENEAEMRGTGGLPGAFAIMVADHGTVKFTTFESDQTLLPPPSQLVPTALNFGSDYNDAWLGLQATDQYVDSNVSPSFPYAAQIWARMWEKVSGQHIDGAISLDPTALSYLLAITGPTTTANGTAVTAANVVGLTQNLVYLVYPDNKQRKDFLVSVTKAVDQKLISGTGSAENLIQVGARAGTEHRLLVWFDDPAIERVLQQSSFAGSFPQTHQPFSAVILNNISTGKLDYYVTRTLAYQRTGCGSVRDVLVTMTLTNNAPVGLPSYITGGVGNEQGFTQPGTDRLLVDFVATPGSQLLSITINGTPTTAATLVETGHPMFRFDAEIPRGTTQTIVAHLDEPAGTQAPEIWIQPGVTPVPLSNFDQPCG